MTVDDEDEEAYEHWARTAELVMAERVSVGTIEEVGDGTCHVVVAFTDGERAVNLVMTDEMADKVAKKVRAQAGVARARNDQKDE
jgi:hypothetical protein